MHIIWEGGGASGLISIRDVLLRGMLRRAEDDVEDLKKRGLSPNLGHSLGE